VLLVIGMQWEAEIVQLYVEVAACFGHLVGVVEHHPDVFPGLFPPLFFDEGCTASQQKIIKSLGWECIPITWQVDEWNFCNATCRVKPISWAYTAVYWYALACVIVFLPTRLRRKEITL